MNISVEVSLYPLREDSYPIIDSFLKALHRYPALRVQTNVMSTQIFGESSAVFAAVEKEITAIYEAYGQCPLVMKVLHGDVSEMSLKDYRP